MRTSPPIRGGAAMGQRVCAAIGAIVTVATLTACAGSPDVALPPPGGAPDYQLGGAYDPDPRVEVVARDRTAPPADDVYSLCYVNGFQTQPGELGDWPDVALLRDAAGELVFDPDWPDEALLDTRTAETRATIADRVIPWIEECAASGFDAVEFDNLDTFTRSDGLLDLEGNTALARDLADAAHAAGLAAGQKNAAEHAETLRDDAGFDFAVVEECAAFAECDAYTSVYGTHVIAIEYTDRIDRSFAEVCADPATPASVVLRDRDLVTPDAAGYAFELCG